MQEAWLKILSQAKHMGATLFFGDEASFALWGSLLCTWAPKGHPPQIKTTGWHKGFGAIEYFTSRSIYHGTRERSQSDSYQAFLCYLLAQVSGTIN